MNNQSSYINQLYNSHYLRHLIRFPFFKNELISKNNPYQIKEAYLIKSNIIMKFKEKYALKEIFNILQENKILDGINYYNCDSNYPKIIQFLNDNKTRYFIEMKKIETSGLPITFNKNEDIISPKYINNKKLIYLNDFEIIDKDFGSYLIESYKNNLQILPIDYILVEGKIILSIIYEQKYIYEIAHINPEGGEIIVEYLIEVKIENNIPININTIILQSFQKFELNNIISSGAKINIEENISFIFHKIDEIAIKKSLTNTKLISKNRGISISPSFNT